MHARRQRALMLEAQARQARARARLLDLKVAERAAKLIAAGAVTAVTLIGLIAHPDPVSILPWR